MSKPIRNINDKNQLHGYQETYWNNYLQLWSRGNCKNDNLIGYTEWHMGKETLFYIR